MMEFDFVGTRSTVKCISFHIHSLFFFQLVKLYFTFYRYSRFGNQILLPDSFIQLFPSIYLDGELWYAFF